MLKFLIKNVQLDHVVCQSCGRNHRWHFASVHAEGISTPGFHTVLCLAPKGNKGFLYTYTPHNQQTNIGLD